MRFFLIHQYSGNKGDRAVLYAMCKMIKANYPQSEITVATSDANLWENYNYYKDEKIRFVPWGWDYDLTKENKIYWSFLNRIKKYTFTIFREAFLRKLPVGKFLVNPQFQEALATADVIISVGGHHFTTILSRDLVSGINFDGMAVLTQKKRLICFSQSFGPFVFHNPHNKKLTKAILSSCYLMPRENGAERALKNFLGTSENIHSTKESVLTLSKYIDYTPIAKRDDAVGLAIYCTQTRMAKERENYQSIIASFCNYAIGKGFSIRFFPMEIKGTGPDDRIFIQEIISRIGHYDKCVSYDMDMETLEHLNEVSKCKVFLGHKTHSTIFALVTGTPLIALAYHPKTIEFLRQFDLESNVIEDKNLSTKWLSDRFDDLCSDLNEYSQLEYQKSLEFAESIEKDLNQAIKAVTEE